MAQDPYCIRVLQYQIKFYQFISKKNNNNTNLMTNESKGLINRISLQTKEYLHSTTQIMKISNW